jgi:hypothetical protein
MEGMPAREHTAVVHPAGSDAPGRGRRPPARQLHPGGQEEAKRTVTRLLRDGSLRLIDAWPPVRARELEALGYLHRVIQGPSLRTGFAFAVKPLA